MNCLVLRVVFKLPEPIRIFEAHFLSILDFSKGVLVGGPLPITGTEPHEDERNADDPDGDVELDGRHLVSDEREGHEGDGEEEGGEFVEEGEDVVDFLPENGHEDEDGKETYVGDSDVIVEGQYSEEDSEVDECGEGPKLQNLGWNHGCSLKFSSHYI